MELSATGGGEIRLQNVNFVDVKVNIAGGSSSVDLSGVGTNQEISVSTGGEYKARDLKSNMARITITAGGTVTLTAYETLYAKVSAGGKVFYAGNPNEIEEDVNAGGMIKNLEE